MKRIQARIWEILDGTVPGDRVAKIWSVFISILIITNVAAVMCETVAALSDLFGVLFFWFEIVSVVVFSVEYVFRVYSCINDERYVHPLFGRLKYSVTFLALVDIISVLPSYLPFFGVDMRFVRVFRLFRITRLAKLGRYSSGIRLITNVFREKKEELILSTAVMLLLLSFSSSAIYYCERSTQPEQFSSIPASLWWAVATLTTVGYGDVYPITTLGKIFAGIVAIIGIGMVALPTGILGAGFVEEIQKKKDARKTCPHCGKEIDGQP
jgi:voltage-gated potassium channel